MWQFSLTQSNKVQLFSYDSLSNQIKPLENLKSIKNLYSPSANDQILRVGRLEKLLLVLHLGFRETNPAKVPEIRLKHKHKRFARAKVAHARGFAALRPALGAVGAENLPFKIQCLLTIHVRAYDYPPPNALQVIRSWSSLPPPKKSRKSYAVNFDPPPQPTKVIRSVSDPLPK